MAVTLFPYYDFVRQIAGNQVDLQMVIPAGMDSHSFEPTPADIRTIQHADVLISNGGTMEHWLDETLAALDTTNMTIVTMMDYVDAVEEEIVEGMEDADHDHEHTHVYVTRPQWRNAGGACGHPMNDDHDHSGETPEEHAAHAHEDDDPPQWRNAGGHAAHAHEDDDHDHSGETPEAHAAHSYEGRYTQLRGSRRP